MSKFVLGTSFILQNGRECAKTKFSFSLWLLSCDEVLGDLIGVPFKSHKLFRLNYFDLIYPILKKENLL